MIIKIRWALFGGGNPIVWATLEYHIFIGIGKRTKAVIMGEWK